MKRLLVFGVFLNAGFLAVRVWEEFPADAQGRAGGPVCATANGDVNGDSAVDVSDGVFILNWLFNGGPDPVALCETPGGLTPEQEAVLGVLRLEGDTLVIEGVNVQIVNGLGATNGLPDDPESLSNTITNGVGNLIVGYNLHDSATVHNRSGSHNIIVGDRHDYTSFGGLVAGQGNSIRGASCSVLGGSRNTAAGESSCVTGGADNTAAGKHSSVTGGRNNQATGLFSAVSGGGDEQPALGNRASGNYSSVSGGASSEASGDRSAVGGGLSNKASGPDSTVSGGCCSEASGERSSVSGGNNVTASGFSSSVSGGSGNEASGDSSSVSGGSANEASGELSSVSGGADNKAIGDQSSVSGGLSNHAEGPFDCICLGP